MHKRPCGLNGCDRYKSYRTSSHMIAEEEQLRTFRHWTPRYVSDRFLEMYNHRKYPDEPWLTRSANQILISLLRDSDVGLEAGSGRSTIWIARHISYLTSVEHDENWFKRVEKELADNKILNVNYIFAPGEESGVYADKSDYVRTIEAFDNASLDFVLVDGIYRDVFALNVLPKIRSGGILVIDNVNWYLPCSSHSPGSRIPVEGPNGSTWAQVASALEDWRSIWTSSGVTDTALFFKPC